MYTFSKKNGRVPQKTASELRAAQCCFIGYFLFLQSKCRKITEPKRGSGLSRQIQTEEGIVLTSSLKPSNE
jgi:hypothetical protein